MSKSFVDSVQAKAQEVAKEDYTNAKIQAADAARSGAYLYPFKGIAYFLTHQSLWRPFTSRIKPIVTLSVAVVSGMFTVTYLPQLAITLFINGPLAVFTTIILVLSESSTIISFVSRTFLLQDSLLDIYDATLLSRNETAIVREGRQVKAGNNPVDRLGKVLKSPLEKFSLQSLVRYVMYLPLNFIPGIGTVLFMFLQGRSRGRTVHDRYFQLKGWSSSRKTEWLQKHQGSYTAFGTVATLLETVPLLSTFFVFTNTVGAALWAADIEEMHSPMEQSTAPGLREAAKKAE